LSGGERDLRKILAELRPRLNAGVFVFCRCDEVPAGARPIMVFHEAPLESGHKVTTLQSEGLTLILEKFEAERLVLAFEYPCAWITLGVNSSLHAIGLLAAVSEALARARISVNAVSAFHHDHLFVQADRADEAMSVLKSLSVTLMP
jgi:hypothetical protein